MSDFYESAIQVIDDFLGVRIVFEGPSEDGRKAVERLPYEGFKRNECFRGSGCQALLNCLVRDPGDCPDFVGTLLEHDHCDHRSVPAGTLGLPGV